MQSLTRLSSRSSAGGRSTIDRSLFLGGLWYSGTFLAILGAHEAGHYLYCRHYGLDASLPYFIPLPPFLTITGTLGAVIRIREPFRTRTELFDVGIAGPVAGLIVLIPALFYGFTLSTVVPEPTSGTLTYFGEPLLFQWIAQLVIGPVADGSTINVHPVVWGCWFGLFATALNLLPFGQLDGGHIVYAVFGERIAKMVSAGDRARACRDDRLVDHLDRADGDAAGDVALDRTAPPGAAESLRTAEQRAPRVCPDRAGRARRLLHADADPDRGSGADLEFVSRFKVESDPLQAVPGQTGPPPASLSCNPRLSLASALNRLAEPWIRSSGFQLASPQSTDIGSTSTVVRRLMSGRASSAASSALRIDERWVPFTKNCARCSPFSRLSGAGAGPSTL